MTKIYLQKSLPIVPEKTEKLSSENGISKISFKEHAYVGSEKSGDTSSKFKKIPVSQTAFYDLGFDPSFSVDGNFFYKKQCIDKEQPSFSFFQLFIQMVRNTIKYFASFLQTPEMKAFQELVQIEKVWHESAIVEGLTYDPHQSLKGIWQSQTAIYVCQAKEYNFFKKLSEVNNSNKSEAYSRELIAPLHAFNRPQHPSTDSKEQILKEECLENRDLKRQRGFILLDNYKGELITHKKFLETINIPGDKLKQAVRDLRSAIREEDYEKFKYIFTVFRKSWNSYINSHNLLKAHSSLYSQEDFFKETYNAYEEEYQKMKNSSFNNESDFFYNQKESENRTKVLADAASLRLMEEMSQLNK